MDKKSYFKGLLSGLLIVLLTTNVVFAATNYKNIKVTFDNVKIIFDGVVKTPDSNNKPITYNGKIYVPLDFMAKSVGKSYVWDSKNKTAYIGSSKNEASVVKTSDGRVQLTLPKGWKANSSSNEMTSSYSDGVSGFIVLRENKSVLASDATIEDYCSAVTKNMTGKLENPETIEPFSIKISSYPALQFELSGEVEKVKIKYLCTIVETGDGYYQLLGYTSQDIYDKNKNSFIKIVNSFKELSK